MVMDNMQTQQFQAGMPSSTGVGMTMPQVVGQPSGAMSGGPLPMVQQVEVRPEPKKNVAGLVKTIVIVILSLALVTFIGLFIWMYLRYNDAYNDVEGQINLAVAEAKDEQRTKDDAERQEAEKYPYKNFAGPVDYGELSFEYPKTWSVYIEADASKGGDFKAYLNPGQIDPISNNTVNALRVSILNKDFEAVAEQYKREVEKRDATLSMESVTVNGITANLYKGVIPGTQMQGFIVIFKIRDKTAVLQTDSVLFEEEYNKLIETVKFNA